MSHDGFRSWEGRCWVDSSPVHIVSEGLPKVRFLTYRLLAHYKTAYLNYSSHKAWDYRSKIVLQELACYNADIICLQDVDLFQEFWYPRLMSMGYDMVFKQRTQEKEYRNEGVLTAFRRDRFQLCRTVAYEFNNAVQDDSKGSTFRERCRTDDVGLITFIQPNNRKDIPCMLGVANAMLSELAVNSDVRAMHMEYFTQQIELANREFQAPILMGVNLNDIPASPVYTLLRTGRVALSAQVPLACTDVRATPTCRGSALVQWLPPKMSIADSPISTYEIAWRPGGSSTLGFTMFRSVVAGDCIHYSEQTDERGKKKIVADAVLQFTIAGLCSDIVYEFIVRGINSEGPGLWSAPSEPVILPNPEKAPRLPDLDQHFFTDVDGVYEIRERVAMSESDWNISLAMKADPLNAPTQLTPRIAGEGRINYPIARSRLLPALDNPRLGWKGSLGGIQDPSMTAEISRDYVLSKSILRDKHGYRERNLNDLQYELSSANEGRYAGSVSSTISILQLSDPAGSFGGEDGPEGTLSTTIDEHNTFSHSVITEDASSVRYPENHLLQQLEEVSIRMVTDDDAQHIPLSTSYMFSSAQENSSAVPSLFKKQREEDDVQVASTVDTASTVDDVFVIPFSGASRPVYRTSKENNARLLYQYPTPLLLPSGDKSVDDHELVEANSVVSVSQAKEHLQLLKVPGLCTFAQLNPVVNPLTHLGPANAIAKTLDGTSLLLDGREVLHHIGASHPRHRHGLGLRSVYEVGGSTSGEPIFTAVIPKERNSFGTETFDYIFYSQSHGLVPCSHLALPSIASVMQSYSMTTGRGETPEVPIIVTDQQTSRPPIAFEDSFDQKVLALYAKAYDLTHDGQDGDEVADGVADSNADDDADDIDYGYGYSEERKKSNKKTKKELTAEMKREKLDGHYTPADVQIMKRMLKESLRKSHALDDQTTQHRPGSTNQNFSAQQNRASSATNSNKMSKKAKALANNVQYYASQYKGNNSFWGGQWQSLPMRNPSRNNFFLPNARFPSSHFALGADFVINEDLLPALWK